MFLRMILAAACLTPSVAFSTQQAFPSDFDQPTEVIGGAGGSDTRERDTLRHLPVILIADNQRIHTDWLGANCGNAEGSVYQAFIDQEFTPFELWMLDLVPAEGYQLTSLELRTDNLKEMIFAVLQYTGANQVNILAHGAGAVLAQATLIKYNLFYAVHSAAYIAGPFHGTYACGYEQCLEGLPLCCNLTPGSDFLQDVLLPDETPHDLRESQGDPWTTPYETLHDSDGDGFRGRHWGGPDCDDNDASIYPLAAETCGDGIDQDCNSVDISCRPGKDRDVPESQRPVPAETKDGCW